VEHVKRGSRAGSAKTGARCGYGAGEVQRLAAEMLPIFESRDVRGDIEGRNALTTRDFAFHLPQRVDSMQQSMHNSR
jgi:hypothetical protein